MITVTWDPSHIWRIGHAGWWLWYRTWLFCPTCEADGVTDLAACPGRPGSWS